MKSFFFIALFAFVLGTGCARRYDITLSNGEVITAKGKPHLDKQKGTWIFIDASGKTNGISAGRVTQVGPQSIGGSGNSMFIKQ